MRYVVRCGKLYIKDIEEGTLKAEFTSSVDDAYSFYDKSIADGVAAVFQRFKNTVDGDYVYEVLEHPAPWCDCVNVVSAINRYTEIHPFRDKDDNPIPGVGNYIAIMFEEMDSYLKKYFSEKEIKPSFWGKLKHKAYCRRLIKKGH